MAKLIVVPTPIGNLEDISLRALRMLRQASFILAEDTRTTGILLKRYEINNRMQSYHKFNEHRILEQLAGQIAEAESVALVSDAGTPSISDPGFLLIRECIRRGIDVECLAGATAFVPALVVSGLAGDAFSFEGFLPHKKGRQTRLRKLAAEERTFILYESPQRLLKTLQQLAEHCGADRQASVSRELSKIYEETRRGSLQELASHFAANPPRGEIVIVVQGNSI
ncbi:MAG: 16S rRNA (cytidine(1402)-2'-O)-methyltransferase [Tannerellaceae bacterium]|jgi:16S rRNA (cytidine1402-2'-O)-methyltransferase|nr:16S rRNA (cytidine(1402)-2'-O)-methyltransferase [Tannerellaceae bacterium]